MARRGRLRAPGPAILTRAQHTRKQYQRAIYSWIAHTFAAFHILAGVEAMYKFQTRRKLRMWCVFAREYRATYKMLWRMAKQASTGKKGCCVIAV